MLGVVVKPELKGIYQYNSFISECGALFYMVAHASLYRDTLFNHLTSNKLAMDTTLVITLGM